MGYKMIIDGSIVDADTHPCYVKYNAKLGMFLECKADDAQFVSSRNGTQWWHIAGSPVANGERYQTVELIESDDDEITALMAAFDANREPITIELPPEEPVPEECASDDAINIIRDNVAAQAMQACEEAIRRGFDVVLSDGKSHHFTLSPVDQLNLISLASMKETFPDGIPYQADGEEFCWYNSSDFDLIYRNAAACRAQHYVYAKQLCAYVNTLGTVSDLRGVVYGMDVPDLHSTKKHMGGEKK